MDAKRKRRQSPGRLREGERQGPASPPWFHRHDESREETDYYQHRPFSKDRSEPFFKKEFVLFQVLASVCLMLGIGVLFSLPNGQLDGARQFVHQSFNQEFEFAAVSGWYEEQFGRPLALVPPTLEVAPAPLEDGESEIDIASALPATGTIAESFEQNGRGIYVETSLEESVEAVRGGTIRFVGEDEAGEWGKTVVVSHYNGGESWYGMLDDIQVNLYDHVEAGDLIGYVSPAEDNESVGVYYFALKEDDIFIDPIDVITLD